MCRAFAQIDTTHLTALTNDGPDSILAQQQRANKGVHTVSCIQILYWMIASSATFQPPTCAAYVYHPRPLSYLSGSGRCSHQTPGQFHIFWPARRHSRHIRCACYITQNCLQTPLPFQSNPASIFQLLRLCKVVVVLLRQYSVSHNCYTHPHQLFLVRSQCICCSLNTTSCYNNPQTHCDTLGFMGLDV